MATPMETPRSVSLSLYESYHEIMSENTKMSAELQRAKFTIAQQVMMAIMACFVT